MKTLKINPQFQYLIPESSDEELILLEKSLLEDGCRDALIIWNNTLIDGHNRYAICKKHNIQFKTKSMDFDSNEHIESWIIQNQLSRRNLTNQQRTYFLGKLYEQNKKQHGGARQSSGQNDHLKTSDIIASKHRVSSKTVIRASEFSTAVDQIDKNVGGDFKSTLLSGNIKISNEDIKELSLLDKDTQKVVTADLSKPLKTILSKIRKHNSDRDQNQEDEPLFSEKEIKEILTHNRKIKALSTLLSDKLDHSIYSEIVGDKDFISDVRKLVEKYVNKHEFVPNETNLNLKQKKDMNILDLFSGAGGFSKGFEQAGFEIVVANEFNHTASETHRLNHPNCRMIEGDITSPDI